MSLAQHIAQKTRERGGPASRARAENRAVLSKAKDLLDLISEKDRSEAVLTLRRGLKATRKVYSTEKKRWLHEPDYRVRHESAMAIMAYAYGKPIERQIVASGTFQELSEILTRVRASPEAMRVLGDRMPRVNVPTEKP